MAEKNALLAAIGNAERSRIISMGEVVQLGPNHVIYEVSRPLQHVYFPQTAVVSLITVLANGRSVEVATVGNEGMVGLPAFLGARNVPGRAIAQIPGEALRVKVATFRQGILPEHELHDLLHRYAQGLFNQISWSVACLRQHSLEQRCARWLLMTHDRVGGKHFLLTQDFLAQMLGVRRGSVSGVASRLQKLGMIRYVRGVITITDRKGLEKKSCECYRVVQDEYRRLIGRAGAA